MRENKKKMHKSGDEEKKMSKHVKEKHWDREIKKEWRKQRKEKKSEKGWTNRKEG